MKLLTTLLVLLAVLVAIPFAASVHADEPILTPEEVPEGYEDVFLDMPAGVEIPTLPEIPTKEEYEAGWSLPERGSSEEDDTLADNPHGCSEQEFLEITYWKKRVPSDHGGGQAEGYAALHYGYTGVDDVCVWWIRAVVGTRITHDGAVDLCRVTRGASQRVYPLADPWWEDNEEVNGCTLDGARVESYTKFVVPGIKWRVNGVHYVENWNDDEEFWYAGGTTSLTKRVP